MAVRALLTGGSDRGVVSAAAIVACEKEKIKIDSYFCVSVGVFIAMAYEFGLSRELEYEFKKLDVKKDLLDENYAELAMAAFVSWADSRSVTRRMLYCFPWIKNALLPKKDAKSIFKDKYIRYLVNKYLTLENYELLKKGKLIEFPVFNITDGRIEIIRTTDNLPYEIFKKFVLAAISIPFFYPAVKIYGKLYVDGGFVSNLALRKGLFRCETGDILLVFHNFPRKPVELAVSEHWRFVGWRSNEARHIDNARNDISGLNGWLDFCQTVESFLNKMFPWRWLGVRRVNKLFRFTERLILGYIGKKLKMPLVKKVEIYPDEELVMFKKPCPNRQDISDAFDNTLDKTRKIIRREVSPYIS